MATLRSFRHHPFVSGEYTKVKKGEYVLLTVYASYMETNDSSGSIKFWLKNHPEYSLFFESPEHYNNTHGGRSLKTLILEKVA